MKEFNLFEIDNLIGLDVFYIKLVLGFICSFLLSFLAIPKIIKVSYIKHLIDEPKERSSHERRIPNLGGLALFIGISISSSIFSYEIYSRYIFISACLVILLFIGLMDDILVVAPNKKIYAQLITATLIAIGSNIRIGNFFGILGFYEIDYFISIIFTIFVFIIFINSFNLIDGIDGLAASVAIIISSAYCYSFFILRDYPMVVFSVIIIGSTFGFFLYNISKKHKIFMGDTGSMILGFLITFMTVRFLNLLMQTNASGNLIYWLPSAPTIAIAILIIPLIDTIAVIFIRIYNKKSPLEADKNHLHHKFLKVGLSHIQTTTLLATINFLILIIAYFCRHLNPNFSLLIILVSAIILIYTPFYILLQRNRNVEK